MDIKLYNFKERDTELPRSELEDAPASGLEVIANKVVKFLLTSYGSDALDPEYGGRALQVTQFSEQYIPKLRLELEEDIKRCLSYIKKYSKNEEKLMHLILVNLKYDPVLSPGRVDAYIELITNKNNRALLDVSYNK